MTPDEQAKAARDLLDAERTGNQIGLLTLRYPEMTIDDAYQIQNAIYRAKLDAGRRAIGWKIGLTSKAMQYALNIDIPDSGILFDDMDFADGAIIPKGRFIQPRVEAEIAFVMKSALSGESVSRDDVLSATDFVAPAIQILDTFLELLMERVLRRNNNRNEATFLRQLQTHLLVTLNAGNRNASLWSHRWLSREPISTRADATRRPSLRVVSFAVETSDRASPSSISTSRQCPGEMKDRIFTSSARRAVG